MRDLLLFGNVSQPPYCNNLFPPVRAFQRAFRTRVVEPTGYKSFEATGGARPALVPDDAVIEHTDPCPDVVVCLGGALHFSERSLRELRNRHVLLAGMLTTAKPVHTLQDEPMEFATFDDGDGLIETVLFPQVYRERGHVLFDQGPFIFRGKVEEEFGAVTVTITHLDRLERAAARRPAPSPPR